MKIPAVIQTPVAIAALIIAPNRVLTGASKKERKRTAERLEMMEQWAQEMENRKPIYVRSTRVA